MLEDPPAINPLHPANSGWQAELTLGFRANESKTILASRKQRGPLAIQRPFYPEGDVCHAYVLHPPGGVVGGDQLTIDITVDAGASALLTTPGATKFYRSAGQQAHQAQTFNISGTLEWLPQENIFFPGSNSQLSSHINLDTEARYIGWEVHCLGRPAINEAFDKGNLVFTSQLHRDGKPLFIDRLTICGKQDLTGAAGLRNQPVVATFLATPADASLLEIAQQCCETPLSNGFAGVTLMNDVLIVRYLGQSTAEAHTIFRTVWRAIRPAIIHRNATPPRIWNT